MTYDDNDKELKIRLRLTADEQVAVEVLASPFDDRPDHANPRHRSALPVTRDDLDRLDDLANARVELAAGMRDSLPAVPARLRTETLGTTLFATLFSGDTENLYRRCLRDLHPQGTDSLRLRLVFDLTADRGNEYLTRLPWELLHDPVEHWFLAQRRRLTLVRELAWNDASRTRLLPAPLPLRLLVVEPLPKDGGPPLDLRTEWDRLHDALAPLNQRGEVEIHRAVTLERMQQTLLDRRIHVLHFMGHGGYLEEEGLGALFFETPDGDDDQVTGDALGTFLTGLPELRLVVLNSCHGARLAGDEGRPAHHGVAAGILQRSGLPAVVAMQQAISDVEAIALTTKLYERLARGAAVDSAMTEARLQLGRGSDEWSTPVLFLQSREGRLFSTDLPREDLSPIQLGVRSMNRPSEEDLGRDLPFLTDDHLDLRDLFEGRYIRDDELWASEVFPRLQDFLTRLTRGPRPVELRLATHNTVAYAAGWILQEKGGLDVAVHQRSPGRGEHLWHRGDGSDESLDGPLWKEWPDVDLGGGADIAVVLAGHREITPQVEAYVRAADLPVGRLLVAQVMGEEGDGSVAGGAHAQRLARSLETRITALRRTRGSRLHLFASVPIALLVFLGRLARPFGRTVLYEHAFEAADPWARYRPSLELPPPGIGGEPPEDW